MDVDLKVVDGRSFVRSWALRSGNGMRVSGCCDGRWECRGDTDGCGRENPLGGNDVEDAKKGDGETDAASFAF